MQKKCLMSLCKEIYLPIVIWIQVYLKMKFLILSQLLKMGSYLPYSAQRAMEL